jgi:hypothetical protein
MQLHVEKFAQGPEKGGNELGATVGGDVGRDSVFREDMNKEEASELRRVYVNVTGDENDLFRCTVDNDQNSIVLTRGRKLLNEVHRYGVPGPESDRKRLQQSVRSVPRFLVALAKDT